MELFVRRAVAADVFRDWSGDTRTDAGVRVSHDSALSDDAILAVVSLLAGDIAGLPMRAVVSSGDITRPLAHQPDWLDTPDPYDRTITDVAHRMQVALSILLAGNAFVLCEPDVFRPVSLTVLNPTRIRVIKPGRERLFEVMGRSSVYEDPMPGDPLDTLSSAQVLHIPYMLRPGRLEGLSPIDAQAGNVGISLAMRKWVETFFGKGAQVSGFVSAPTSASNDQVEQVADRIEKRWGSWRKAGVIGVLAGGATWVKTGLSPNDADLATMWRRQLQVAARIYGVPPFMAGSEEPAGVAYASSVERAQHYIDHCLNRYTRPIEKAYSLLVPGDRRLSSPGSDTGVRFVYDAFLRGDPKARWETHLAALGAKARTIGEVRALENLPPMSEYSPEYLAGPDGLLQTPNNNDGQATPEVSPDESQRSLVAAPSPAVININQPITLGQPEPTPVTVNVPDQPAPVVRIDAPVTVTPTVTPPDVIVNVPDQPAPVVNVERAEVTVEPAPVRVIAQPPTSQDIRIVSMPVRSTRRKVTQRTDRGQIAETVDIEEDIRQ